MNNDLRKAIKIKREQYDMDNKGVGLSPILQIVKADEILISFVESVLSVEGWPEEEKIRPPEIMLTPQQESWNKCLTACRLAHARDMAEKDAEYCTKINFVNDELVSARNAAYAIVMRGKAKDAEIESCRDANVQKKKEITELQKVISNLVYEKIDLQRAFKSELSALKAQRKDLIK
jgi:hypothetical protein